MTVFKYALVVHELKMFKIIINLNFIPAQTNQSAYLATKKVQCF